MLPAITLRRPDNLLAVVDVMPVFPAGRETRAEVAVIEEGLGLLRDQRTRLAGLRIHLDDRVRLVAALVVLESKAATVFPPDGCADGERIGEQGAIDLDRKSTRLNSS